MSTDSPSQSSTSHSHYFALAPGYHYFELPSTNINDTYTKRGQLTSIKLNQTEDTTTGTLSINRQHLQPQHRFPFHNDHNREQARSNLTAATAAASIGQTYKNPQILSIAQIHQDNTGLHYAPLPPSSSSSSSLSTTSLATGSTTTTAPSRSSPSLHHNNNNHHQPQQHNPTTVTATTIANNTMSQFLDTSNQQLVAAHFNAQHAANLVANTNHFADQLSVADANQFVTVVQQQQQQQQQQQHSHHQQQNINHQLHDVANNFTSAAFFHQHHNQPVVAAAAAAVSLAPTTTTTTTNQHQAHSQPHLNHHPQSFNQLNSHPQHQLNQAVTGHQFDQQQLTCVNVMNTDNLNHLASSGHVIFDQTNRVIRIPNASGVPVAIVNTISELRHQHQQHLQQQHNHQATFPSMSICDINGGNNSGSANNTNNSNNINSNHNNSSSNNNSHNSRVNRPNESGQKRSSSNTDANVSTFSASGNRNTTKSSNTSANNTNASGKAISNANGNSKSSKTKGANKKSEKSNGLARNSESPRRTFACPTCGKGFTEKFNMKRHMQIHSQSRQKHTCEQCSKSFAWKDNFIRHQKAAHANNLQSFPN